MAVPSIQTGSDRLRMDMQSKRVGNVPNKMATPRVQTGSDGFTRMRSLTLETNMAAPTLQTESQAFEHVHLGLHDRESFLRMCRYGNEGQGLWSHD